jgi:amino acid adenylation domain-containing protein
MNFNELLDELQRRDIRLYLQEGELRCKALPGRLDAQLRQAVEQHKPRLLESLAQASREPGAALHPIPRQEFMDVSFAQRRLWLLQQLEPDNAFYNRPAAIRLEGRLDYQALNLAMNEIVRRHETLRTRFVEQAHEVRQVIDPPAALPLPITDLRDQSAEGFEERLQQAIIREARLPFDLQHGPLVRVRLFLLRDTSREVPTLQVLSVVIHHIVFDGWSVGVLIDEFAALYSAFVAGHDSPLPELPLQYADFADWQRQALNGPVLDQHLAYWRSRLGGEPARLDLPTDRPRPPQQSFRGANHVFRIAADQTAGVHALARRLRIHSFTVWLAVFQILMQRYSGQRDIVLGTVIANRTRPELERLIGFFVNTLVLRADLGGRPSFENLLRQDQEHLLQAYAHQDLPFEVLVEALKPNRDPGRNPLFQVAIVLHNAPIGTLCLPGLQVDPVGIDSGATQFDLSLHLTEEQDGMHGVLEYNPDLFDAETVARLARRFDTLLDAALTEPLRCIDDLNLLCTEDLEELRQSQRPQISEIEIHDNLISRFAAQARRDPDAIAVSDEQGALSYARLRQRTEALARRLLQRGVRAESRIGLLMGRDRDLLVGMLGILQAGGAYVPLDPEYPSARLRYIAEDAGLGLVVSASDCLARAQEIGCEVVLADRDEASGFGLPEFPAIHPDQLAYVLYTSGSTGKPKGVEISHRNVLRLFEASRAHFDFGPRDVFSLFHSFAFDFSVWEIWGALLHGARLAIAPLDVARSAEDFLIWLVREQITVLNQTPSAFYPLSKAERQSVESGNRALCWIIFGGEALDTARLLPWFERHGDSRPQLVNMYGITETTVHVTFHRLCEAECRSGPVSPIGLPLHDLSALPVDRAGRPLPTGIPGELWVGGAGLARGYHGQAGLSAARFVPDCFTGAPGERLYTSGDRVRRRHDGTLEYLGRIDQQIKIRGFRIEPGEIEARLLEFPGIDDAAVVVREDPGGERRLLAYLACPATQPNLPELRAGLQQVLPAYMVPSGFVVLPGMPLTANGKLDRAALPEPGAFPSPSEHFVAPEGPVEELIAEIWQELLGLPQIGALDNFFDAGGHSLLAARAVSRIRHGLEIELPLKTLFEHPVLREFAEIVANRVFDSLESQDQTNARDANHGS